VIANGEFVDIFRQEAEERLDAIVETLLEVEGGRGTPEAVNALFRETHTLKGAAGMLDFDEVREIAHAMEDVLSDVRKDGGLLPRELVEPLMHAADALRAQIRGEGGSSAAVLRELAGEAPQPAVTSDAAPVIPVRISAQKVDRLLDLVGEFILYRRQIVHTLKKSGLSDGFDGAISDEIDRGDQMLIELKDAAIEIRMLPLSSVTLPLRRMVREAARQSGKDVELVIADEDTELDRTILEGLADSLTHLLRNAVGHGIETPAEREAAGKPRTGRVEIHADRRAGMVEITVADDGRGVAAKLVARSTDAVSLGAVLAEPGLSTASDVTELSGRGVGLDAVKKRLAEYGGSLAVRSEPGRGTRVTLSLPVMLTLLDVLLVERGANVFGLPLASIEEALFAGNPLILSGRNNVGVRGVVLPLYDLADLIGATAPLLPSAPPALVVAAADARFAISCDALLGEQEVMIKRLEPPLNSLTLYLGTALLADGRIALILDPHVLALAQGRVQPERLEPAPDAAPMTASRVLVVEDSFTVRELQRSILEAAGYHVTTAQNGRHALQRLDEDANIGLVVTDVEMPELDGFGLISAIRADRERSSLPVVVVTSLGGDDDRRRGIEAGADAYVVKRSYDQQDLLDTVGRLIGR
jgi:two-component system chemotaxis sensor kinase CheA